MKNKEEIMDESDVIQQLRQKIRNLENKIKNLEIELLEAKIIDESN